MLAWMTPGLKIAFILIGVSCIGLVICGYREVIEAWKRGGEWGDGD